MGRTGITVIAVWLAMAPLTVPLAGALEDRLVVGRIVRVQPDNTIVVRNQAGLEIPLKADEKVRQGVQPGDWVKARVSPSDEVYVLEKHEPRSE